MVNTVSFELVISTKLAEENFVVFVRPLPGITVARLIDDLLVKLGIAGNSSSWELRHDAATLSIEDRIENAVVAAGLEIVPGQSIHLQLLPLGSSSVATISRAESPHALSFEPPAVTVSTVSDEGDQDTFGDADSCDLSDEVAACVSDGDDDAFYGTVSEHGEDGVRRATVRYYSRMRPDRVYPLLVIVTNRFVETVRMAGAAQRSSEQFTVRTDSPVEIEPILPGCDCYPPRITALLESDDTTFGFRIVPSAVGRLDGAKIVVRQGHVVIASIDLDVRVIPSTNVIVSGLMTFALPATSTIMERFGLSFTPNPEAGVNAYLSVAHLLFDCLTPLSLTACLGGVTTAIWWLGRPRIGDVFFDVETITPDEKLQRLRTHLANDVPGVRKELEAFVDAYPENFPARLMKARHGVRIGRNTAALEDYIKAFSLGTASAADYETAYRLARKSGTSTGVLRILELAYSALGSDTMPSRLLYNLACFRALSGNESTAMQALSEAFASGYSNIDRATSDADLRSLRHRVDFQALVAKAVASQRR